MKVYSTFAGKKLQTRPSLVKAIDKLTKLYSISLEMNHKTRLLLMKSNEMAESYY